ncbi:MAG TPA: aldehyde dehydrogenase family protein [Thermoleophilaceae bacterium]|nr:aldehyde dehydrogenase family protein [Thermoleophilaceae bacterium]
MATVEQQQKSDGGPAARTTSVENPATGEKLAEVPALDRDAVVDLVGRARAAQPAWEALGIEGRGALLRDMRRWLIQNRRRVMQTLSDENGKPWEDSQIEIFYVADSLGFWARNAKRYLAEERVRPHSPFLLGRKLVNRFRPYGVVGVIGPWNYPLVNNFGDAIPALMAGNTVVLKPSQVTPLSSLLMEEGLREVGVPHDVFRVANGSGGEVGGALVGSVDMLHFTGSTAVGKQLAAQAAERLLPITLELGGNDPMIVLEDADLERAANAAVWGGLQNGGQTCISVERIYVEGGAYEPFVEKVVDKVRAVRQGVPGGLGSVEVGAVTYPEQAETIEEHVRDAVDKGAKVEVGGRRGDGPGTFFQPTVLTGVDHSMKVMTEETFGPTLPIMRVDSADQAVELANDSNYGLDSSVFAKNPERGEEIARRVEAGAAVVNDALTNYFATEIPIGGMKESGLGARHGAVGIQKYCQRQNLVVTRFGLKRELYYFPYSKLTGKLFDWALVALYGRGSRRR